ncbi:MAG: hypothetical protein QXU98_08330 [Candidatus Parvarchaeota archaeon]
MEMVFYFTNNTGGIPTGAIATVIIKMNSSSEVDPAITSVEKECIPQFY